MSRSFYLAVVLLSAPFSFGAACEQWPLFAHLPDEDPGAPAPSVVDVNEDAFLPDLAIQGIGALQVPSIVTVTGDAEDCGFDDSAPWPIWPDHPLDTDGDGAADTYQPRYSGWYTGDTDLFGLDAEQPATISVVLEWVNAPEGAANAPYRPTEEDDAWRTESDLDWVLFDVADGAPTDVWSDAGFSTRYPEVGAQRFELEPGSPVAVAVGCHHEVPSGYTLTIDVRAR